jgi:hypothetical protein
MPDPAAPAGLSTLDAGTIQDTGRALGSVTPGTVADSIALSDAALRQEVTQRIVRAFLLVNGVVLATVLVMFVVDCVFLGIGTVKPADRLV